MHYSNTITGFAEFSALEQAKQFTGPLSFGGSILHNSSEYLQVLSWCDHGMANRAIWAACDATVNAKGKPSSYVIKAIKAETPSTCAQCKCKFYPSRAASDSDGKFCRSKCYQEYTPTGRSASHRGLGQRRHTAKKRQPMAVGPLTDYHLVTEFGARATVAIRGSITDWLSAENSIRNRGGLPAYKHEASFQ